ncbi:MULTISPECIES: hypothetical protein [Methylosinus]|uniref:hypothetical protein n=1 Tax=Methylosinus TaxID=425 RepID=UPI00138B064F|nr:MULTISPECIES: hypothetical protein [Methylosinus]
MPRGDKSPFQISKLRIHLKSPGSQAEFQNRICRRQGALSRSNVSYFIEKKWPFQGRRSTGYRFASYGFFGERTRFLLNRCAVPNSPTALRRKDMEACVFQYALLKRSSRLTFSRLQFHEQRPNGMVEHPARPDHNPRF